MRLLSKRRQGKLDQSIGKAVQAETQPIETSEVDDYFCCVLMSTVSAAGGAVSEFVEVARGEPQASDLSAFLKGVDGGAAIAPALRVVAWGYVNRLVAEDSREHQDEVLEVAKEGLGLRTEWERRVAGLDPRRGTKGDAERRVAGLDPRRGTKGDAGMMLRFNRTVYEGMIATVNGGGGDSGVDLPGIMVWTSAFSENWGLYRRTLESLATDGPPAV